MASEQVAPPVTGAIIPRCVQVVHDSLYDGYGWFPCPMSGDSASCSKEGVQMKGSKQPTCPGCVLLPWDWQEGRPTTLFIPGPSVVLVVTP